MALPLSYTRSQSIQQSQPGPVRLPRGGLDPAGRAAWRPSFDPRVYGSLREAVQPVAVRQWGVQDSNLRRRCHQIYSLTPLTARETPRLRFNLHLPASSSPAGSLPQAYPYRMDTTSEQGVPTTS